jgi:site-specific recombinase XerD
MPLTHWTTSAKIYKGAAIILIQVISMFEPMIDEMKLRNYSLKTIKLYVLHNQHFLRSCRKNPQAVTEKDIRQYLLQLIGKQLSSSAINLSHNALNFYYMQIMKRRFSVPFQKREHHILREATTEEIRQILAVTKNQKHHLLISLLYATGVRVSEAVRVQLEHLNFEKKLLLVRQGKGNKDRYTILSEAVIHEIKSYLAHRPYQNSYLFASREGHICEKTAEEILAQAKHKAGLSKNITPHTLRRSFATHHINQNTRLEFIQSMMGHKDIRTTRGYQYITPAHLEPVRSPHDFL